MISQRRGLQLQAMAAVKFEDHPVLKEIQEYGLSDEKQSQIAFMVYMELCEDKGWWNVRTHVCQEFLVVFLSGHATRSKPREIILPVSTDVMLSPAQIQKYIQTVKLPDYQTEGLTLAIYGGSSSTVYYKLTSGLVLPDTYSRREDIPTLKRNHVSEQTAMYINSKQAKPESQNTTEQNNT